ncbi:MAG: Smr/MutS family protein [Gammaproteobacteria bacterium]
MTKPKKPGLTEDDKIVFRTAMRGVKALKQPLKADLKITQPTRPVRKPLDNIDEDLRGFEFSDHENLDSVTSDDTLEFSRSGVQHKMLRKLRQGQYNVDAILDLHGKTATEAREALSGFLHNCQQRNLRHVLIIHGKGRDSNKPILKNKLNHWLRQTEQVLAFCSATARDGRSGALYVLLRR